MKYLYITFLIIFFSCENSRIKNLESENDSLKKSIDSMEMLAENHFEKAEEILRLAQKERNHKMDSVIIAENLKVLRLNEGCDKVNHSKLLESIKPLEQDLEAIGIEVIYTYLEECGYELHHGARKKVIEDILSEDKLKNEIESFYDIRLNKES